MATACRKNAPTGGKTMFYADTAEAAQCAAFRSSQPRPLHGLGSRGEAATSGNLGPAAPHLCVKENRPRCSKEERSLSDSLIV
jgi:hypothetical protein